MGKCGKIVQLDSRPHSSSARLRKFHKVADSPNKVADWIAPVRLAFMDASEHHILVLSYNAHNCCEHLIYIGNKQKVFIAKCDLPKVLAASDTIWVKRT